MIREERLDAIRSLMTENDWDILILTGAADFVWATNCHTVAPDRLTAIVITPQARGRENGDLIVPWYAVNRMQGTSQHWGLRTWKDGGDPVGILLGCIEKAGARTIAIGGGLSSGYLLTLRDRVPRCKLIDASVELSDLRAVKTADEVSFMRGACTRLEAALDETLQGTIIGRTERDVASLLFRNMLAQGLSVTNGWVEFAAGENSSDPTHTFGERIIQPGDPILIDWAGTYRGYFGDLCRTVVVGEPTKEFEKLYGSIVEILSKLVSRATPGVTYGDLDRLFQRDAAACGYDDFRQHRLGHGIGLIAHDAPFVQDGNEALLREGHTFTLEPGIYVRSKFGARIEYNLVFDGRSAVRLDTDPTELRIVR